MTKPLGAIIIIVTKERLHRIGRQMPITGFVDSVEEHVPLFCIHIGKRFEGIARPRNLHFSRSSPFLTLNSAYG